MVSRNNLTMCRLCLCENECFVSIFEPNDWQDYVAAEVISDLLQSQVSETDGFPHVVCFTCLTKLTDFKLFKECCQKSKVAYKKMFVSSESLMEHQPEMECSGTFGTEEDISPEESPIEARCEAFGTEEDKSHEESPIETTIKTEEVDICSSSGEESQDPLKETENEVSCGPILLKYEVLQFNKNRNPQEERVTGSSPVKGVGGKKNRFECHHCKKVLTTKQGFTRHVAAHGIGNFFKCEVCCKTFGSNADLINHAILHSNEKPHKCNKCTARFSYVSKLNTHMKIHSQSKPFCCKECNSSFNQNSDLKAHMKIHVEVRPFQCVVCHTNFRRKSALTKHIQYHCGKPLSKCDVCSKEFNRSDYLRKHKLVHTGGKPHQCIHCSMRFRFNENLIKHLKTCVKKS